MMAFPVVTLFRFQLMAFIIIMLQIKIHILMVALLLNRQK